ncbi:RNA-metabolising metallo-beta-lactamase [Anaerocolumna aminovalerica]|uniref:RNA-metabolising metallo-beta-lactamase n=2 Tax=Anaerocolumna aminovalerica TaxID=1527 RepID=A0A1I5EDZ2_9FIRM|nr:RNA-metabolising metallo-beta-lactamase [Anaerocolumna aminovalerica]
MTMDLVRVQLYDSLKIMNNREAEIPLYAEQDVVSTLNRIFPIGYEVKFPIFEDMFLTLYNAGHIAGASFCYIQGKEGALFYSGDFSAFSQKSIEGAKLPKLRPDVAIVESTYGDRLHSNLEIEEKALVDFVNEAMENNGKVLIPAFALGRAQEVILILKSALNKGQLKNVKVYVDGLVRDVNRVYNRNPIYLKKSLGKKVLKGLEPFYDDNIVEVKPNDNREELLKEQQVVFVASSGMLTGGPSAYYAEKIAPMENGYIAITGYQDEESPGRQLLDLLEAKEDRYLKLNGVGFPVKGQIKKIGLSAHSDKSEIKGLIDRLSARNVILVHGNNEVVRNLGQEMAADYKGRIFTPECGEQIHIEIRNPRKQLKKHIPYVMNHSEELSEKLMSHFYEYMTEHYGNRLFTLEELYYIWHGVNCYEDEQMKGFKALIMESVYFESDARRLFLWKARDKQDVEEDLKEKELNQQQLTLIIEELFKEFPIRRLVLIWNKRKFN